MPEPLPTSIILQALWNTYYANKSGFAEILSMHRSEMLTGTESMLLIEHILSRMSIQRTSLVNKARITHFFGGHQLSISLIELRCISGKTTDWYSDFGFFNEYKDEIAMNMKEIHDSMVPILDNNGSESLCSLGPALHTLWMKPDKMEFYKLYSPHRTKFYPLLKLRNGKWTKSIKSHFVKIFHFKLK